VCKAERFRLAERWKFAVGDGTRYVSEENSVAPPELARKSQQKRNLVLGEKGGATVVGCKIQIPPSNINTKKQSLKFNYNNKTS